MGEELSLLVCQDCCGDCHRLHFTPEKCSFAIEIFQRELKGKAGRGGGGMLVSTCTWLTP